MAVRKATALAVSVIAIGLMISTATLAAGSRGVTVKLKASEAANAAVADTVQLYGASHALVIGIDKYTNGWSRLSNAVEDARVVAKELERQGFEVALKTDLKADALRTTLREFFAIKGADPDARLLLWYAGHGHTIGGEGFMVPADAPPDTSPAFLVSALPMRDFGSLVRLARSKHVLSVFDSCFSGTIFQARAGATPRAITNKTTKPVRQFITSGDAGQQVRDDGSFREYFVRALTGDEQADFNSDGYVTGEELGLFLNQQMAALTSAAQTPKSGKLHDVRFNQGDFVFVLPTQEVAALATPAPTGGGFSLDDLKKQQEVSAGWDRWQSTMQSAFNQSKTFVGGADLKQQAWSRFLAAYSQDNPFSSEDEQLRAEAKRLRALARRTPVPDKRTPSTRIVEVLAEALVAARLEEEPSFVYDSMLDIAKVQVTIGNTREATKRIAEALVLARKIKNNSDRTRAFCAISKAQARVGDVEKAKKTIDETLATSISIEKVVVLATVLVCIAEAHIEADDLNKAKVILKKALSLSSDRTDLDFNLMDISKAQFDAGDIDAAFSTARGLSTYSRFKAMIYIAKAQFDAGDTDAAFSTARDLSTLHYRSRAMIHLANAQAKDGDIEGTRNTLDEALAMARSEKDAKLRHSPLIGIAELQTKIGDIEEARKTLTEAQAAARLEEEPHARSAHMAAIAKAQLDAGDDDVALETALDVKWPLHYAKFGVAYANTSIKAGDFASARENLAISLKHARSSEDTFWNRHGTLIAIAKALWKAGGEREAKKLLAEVIAEAKIEAAKFIAVVPWTWIVGGQARTGDIAGALATARSLQNPSTRSEALTKVALVMAELDVL